MKLIERRVAGHYCDCGKRPVDPHIAPARAYSAQHQNTQNKIFREVRAFADKVMNFKKGGHRYMRHQPMENWDDDSARVLGRER